MPLTQTERKRKAREVFNDMANELNILEEELSKPDEETNKVAISYHFGKIYENYKRVVDVLAIYKNSKDDEDV